MVFYCFSGIQTRYKQLLGRTKTCSDVTVRLPDDVVIEILSRLHVDQVLGCRRVCVRWHVLTSSHEYLHAYLKTATPTIFLHNVNITNGKPMVDLFAIDYATGGSIEVKRIHSEHITKHQELQSIVSASCNGLLLFPNTLIHPGRYTVRNFVTGKLINFEAMESTYPCAIFFNHSMRKYNTLHVTLSSSDRYFYHIFTDEGKLRRGLGNFPYVPARDKCPITINGTIYWLVNRKTGYEEVNSRIVGPPCSESIMFFDTIKEEFGARSHPEPCCSPMIRVNSKLNKHGYMHLLEMEGSLALCSLHRLVMHVWYLDDVRGWNWIKRWEVELGWGLRNDHSFRHFPDSVNGNHQIIPMSIKSNELLIWWTYSGLYQYDLQLNTVRQIATPINVRGRIIYTKSVKSVASLPAYI